MSSILEVGTSRGQDKERTREAFLNNRVERKDGHLIWTGRTSALTGEPVGYLQSRNDGYLYPGYVLAYVAVRGADIGSVKDLTRICSEPLCVEPAHWRRVVTPPPKATVVRRKAAPKKPKERKRGEVLGTRIYPATAETCDAGHELSGDNAKRTKAENGSVTCRLCRRIYDIERSPFGLRKPNCANGHDMSQTRASTDAGVLYCSACQGLEGFVMGNCQEGMGPHSLAEAGVKTAGGSMRCQACHDSAMCKNGLHSLDDPEHGMVDSSGFRRCRTCRNARRRVGARKESQNA